MSAAPAGAGGYPDLARHWSLDPAITFLNHGSFGACPTAVLEAQRRIRDRMERDPVQFFVRDLECLLDAARGALADFLRADADDLAFVVNATAGVNAVLRSIPFEPGDEILTTNHAYGACQNAAESAAGRAGTRLVVARVPFPIDGPDRVVEAVLAHVSPRTRLALIDHVTSPTALVFPIERIVAELAERGVDTLVDGAHAPGLLDLDVRAVGAAYYAGNCHKWLCAPKGAGFLHVRRDRQHLVLPLSISHGARSMRTDRTRFRLLFDWSGTYDPTAWLCVPESIRMLGTLLPGGWPDLRERNRGLARDARHTLCGALGIAPPCPEEMLGSMATIPLPDAHSTGPTSPIDTNPLQDALMDRYAIEVPVSSWPEPPRRILRVSAQVYNAPEHYERLARALEALLAS